MTRRCAACDASLTDDAKYCTQCGSEAANSSTFDADRLLELGAISHEEHARLAGVAPALPDDKLIEDQEPYATAPRSPFGDAAEWRVAALKVAGLFAGSAVILALVPVLLFGGQVDAAQTVKLLLSRVLEGSVLIASVIVAPVLGRRTRVLVGVLAWALLLSLAMWSAILMASSGWETMPVATLAQMATMAALELVVACVVGARLAPKDPGGSWQVADRRSIAITGAFAAGLWAVGPLLVMIRFGYGPDVFLRLLPEAWFWIAFVASCSFVVRRLAEANVSPEALAHWVNARIGASRKIIVRTAVFSVGGLMAAALVVNATASACNERRVDYAGSYYSESAGGILGQMSEGRASGASCPLGPAYFGQMQCVVHGPLVDLMQVSSEQYGQ